MSSEKSNVALSSFLAAIFLTSFKLIVGFTTGSLGIISEGVHSFFDLLAAGMTLIAVRYSDKPADYNHHYGHGKIENLSALVETILLLITCGWIVSEAVHRLTTGKLEIEVTFWSFFVIITSIIIDFTRSRALSKAAKKFNSQALEADALHFSSDILSSLVVLIGLIAYTINFKAADSISSIIVAFVVVVVSYRLGKRAINVLLDAAPQGINEKVKKLISDMKIVHDVHDIKIRNSGPDIFIEMNIHLLGDTPLQDAHKIASAIEEEIQSKVKNSIVHIHMEPADHN
ncbi:MAG: cation diffusion facilitator family transporter [Ignavibacteriaceae bacterium]|nr:cation diffusion facilitator family transporter [Ignavibacteriaceae bacterium]